MVSINLSETKLQKLKKETHDLLIDVAPYVAEKIIGCSLEPDHKFDLQDAECCVVGSAWNGSKYTCTKGTAIYNWIGLGDDFESYKDKNLECVKCCKFSVEFLRFQIDSYYTKYDYNPTPEFLRHVKKFVTHVKKSHPELIKSKEEISKQKKLYKNRNRYYI